MNAFLMLGKWIWGGLKWLAGLVFPMFSSARGLHGPGPRTRRVLHVLLLIVIVVVLWQINHRTGLDAYLWAPRAAIDLREVWLPLLFLLVYSLCWLGWILWRLLGPDQVASQFPDIDQAWDEAMVALEQAGIGLTEAPLFLVLGRPAGGEKALFHASQVTFSVREAPRRLDAPLYVSAHRDGIYLTCAGASLLGRQASILSGALSGEILAGRPEPEPVEVAAAPARVEDFSALGLSEPSLLSDDSLLNEPSPAAAVLASAEPTAPVLILDDDSEPAARSVAARSLLLKDVDEVERLTARLRHLCQRIARDRRPFCPINGILLLIPYAATDNESDAKDTATICQRDLAAAREVLQVQCPIVALMCDLERAPGFAEFLKYVPDEQRKRLLGQRFPLVPDLDSAGKLRMVERGVQWVGNVLLPALIYKLWRVEASRQESFADLFAANIRLCRFLAQVRERQRRLARILTRGIVVPSQGPLMLAGCYLAGTGRDASREQGFVAGAFRRLIEHQNDVAWTPEALAEDAEFRRWTVLGYLGLLGLVVLGLATFGVLGWTAR